MDEAEVNLQRLSESLSNESQRWWAIAIIGQILVTLLNVAITLTILQAQYTAIVSAVLTVVSNLCQWYSDVNKRAADSVKRKFEGHDGLGWPVTGKEISDLLASLSSQHRNRTRLAPERVYFASKTPQSARRLVENVEESSWWSKHLAGTAWQLAALLCAAIFSLSLLTLITTLQSAPSQTIAENVAKVTTSILVLTFSGGYFRLSFEYFRFSRDAEKIEDRAYYLLSRESITEIDAIKLLHDYQVARAGSPALPSWIWNSRQKHLNAIWKQRLQSKPR